MAAGDILEVQVDNNQGSSATSLSVTLNGEPAATSLVCAIVNAESSLPADLDQTGFTKSLQYTDTGQEGCLYWKIAGAGFGTTVSLDVNSATQDRTMVVLVIEGPFVASPLNDSNVNTKEAGGSGSSETGDITTTAADCFLLGVAYAGLATSHVDCVVHGTGGNSFVKATDGVTIGFGRAISAAECRGIGSSSRVVSSTGAYSTRFSWVNSTPAEVACTENWGAIAAFEISGGATPLELQHTAASVSLAGQNHELAQPTKVSLGAVLQRRSDGALIASRSDLEYRFWLKSEYVGAVVPPVPDLHIENGSSDGSGNVADIDMTGIYAFGDAVVGSIRVPTGGESSQDIFDFNEFTVT